MQVAGVQPELDPVARHDVDAGVDPRRDLAGGTVMTPAQTATLSSIAHENGIAVHVDGARILNACAALDVPLRDFAGHVDTLSINLNKGLSAPGGVLCGPKDVMTRGPMALLMATDYPQRVSTSCAEEVAACLQGPDGKTHYAGSVPPATQSTPREKQK